MKLAYRDTGYTEYMLKQSTINLFGFKLVFMLFKRMAEKQLNFEKLTTKEMGVVEVRHV